MQILLFEDKLGITENYFPIWNSMLMAVGLDSKQFTRVSIWRAKGIPHSKLLIRKGNRKSPGFNPDYIHAVSSWFHATIEDLKPDVIVIQDTALLGIIEPAWDIATIDNLRGGVYKLGTIPLLVMQPISAVHTKKQPKDIKILNDGEDDKDAWEESDREEGELWLEPYTYPLGRWVINADLNKLRRICNGVQAK